MLDDAPIGVITRPLITPLLYTPAFDLAADKIGVFLDPADNRTRFTTSVGDVVANPGDSVGLLLGKDKGLGLGPELIVNGDFEADLSGWSLGGIATQTVEWVAGRLHLVSDGTYTACVQSIPTVVGETYKVSVDLDVISGNAQVNLGGTYRNSTVPTTIAFYIVATSTTTQLSIKRNGAVEFYADNVSVKHVLGNHASQLTAGQRPTYNTEIVNGKTLHFIQGDGVDDFLSTESLDFTSSDKVNVFIAAELQTGAEYEILLETSDVAVNNGAFYAFVQGSGGLRWQLAGTQPFQKDTASPAVLPSRFVASATMNIGGVTTAEIMTAYFNGDVLPDTVDTAGTGNLGDHKLYLLSRAGLSLFTDAKIYCVLIILGEITEMQRLRIQDYMNKKVGL